MMWQTKTGRFTLLYILGSGHCGSTLLDMLLNGHSQIIGMGELVTLRRYILLQETVSSQPRSEAERKINANILNTPFWQRCKRCYEARSGAPFSSLAEACQYPKFRELVFQYSYLDIKKAMLPWYNLFACIHETSGAEVITDASKFPHRLYLLKRSDAFSVKVIHLIRDGRGVVNSYFRKYHSFKLALQRWMYPNLESMYLRRLFSDKDWIIVKYENLAMNPEETLAKICNFLGLEFERNMLFYRRTPYIGLGGNRMREKQTDERIFLDERWRKELSWKYRLAFAVAGGWLNKLYGYGAL